MADGKKYLEEQLAAAEEVIENLTAEIEELTENKTIDPVKGSGYLKIPAWATDSTIALIRYPVIAFTAMGINSADKIQEAIKKVETESKEFHIAPNAANRTATSDDEGVSNLPAIADVNNKIIGKKVRIVLPKKINRAGGRGKPQKYATCRMPTTIPLAGFALTQLWLNLAAANDADKIKFFYGPSNSVKYHVPSDEANAKKMLAKGEKVTPTGTPGQGQGQA